MWVYVNCDARTPLRSWIIYFHIKALFYLNENRKKRKQLIYIVIRTSLKPFLFYLRTLCLDARDLMLVTFSSVGFGSSYLLPAPTSRRLPWTVPISIPFYIEVSPSPDKALHRPSFLPCLCLPAFLFSPITTSVSCDTVCHNFYFIYLHKSIYIYALNVTFNVILYGFFCNGHTRTPKENQSNAWCAKYFE